jgi:hypothetical protein
MRGWERDLTFLHGFPERCRQYVTVPIRLPSEAIEKHALQSDLKNEFFDVRAFCFFETAERPFRRDAR